MDFSLTEEQKSLKALAREFCKREVPEGPIASIRNLLARRGTKDPKEHVPWDMMEKLHRAGFKQLTQPEKYGGGGAGALTAFVVSEELTRCGGAAGIVARHFFSSSEYLSDVANEQQQDEFCPQDAQNPHFFLVSAQSEAEAFGDIIWPYEGEGSSKVMKTMAYQDGDEFVINGEKAWCSGGAAASLIVVHTRTDKAAPISKGATMFFVPKDTPGVSVVRINDIFGPHHLPNSCLYFDNVRVPKRYLIGEINKGWGFMWKGVYRQALGYYSNDIGMAQALFEYVRDFAKQRIAGGRPIIEHGNVGPLISEMAITIEAARILCYRGCQMLDDEYKKGSTEPNPSCSFMVDTIRAYVINATVKICTLAAEVLAGLGSTSEAPLEAFILRAFGSYHAEGTPIFRLYRAAKQIDSFVPTGY
ncbi:MAG: acyl-CoA/acyl-ACP dehydrogenase [Dehalococcoidales bacterium]|nr:acyl-CoA/acyl-ACP dehydrogenase [Dehalococcoidales bacterium]